MVSLLVEYLVANEVSRVRFPVRASNTSVQMENAYKLLFEREKIQENFEKFEIILDMIMDASEKGTLMNTKQMEKKYGKKAVKIMVANNLSGLNS